ncbi:MAG: DNA-processing protein DprA [Oscillospiraceae bacterium]|nr:DNA-processing protein DprA [Oscillospiraceae bacterium]
MRTYSQAERCLLLLYALPDEGKPLPERLYRKLFEAFRSLSPQTGNADGQVDIPTLLELGAAQWEAEEILSRLERETLLEPFLRNLHDLGIQVVTRISPEYPRRLRETLGDRAPLILYCLGNTGLFAKECISLVGSRKLLPLGRDFSRRAGREIARQGYTYCSGGALGADTEGFQAADSQGGTAVLFLADALVSQGKRELYKKALEEKRLLLVSEHGWDIPFSTARAYSRNRLIHAMGQKVLVAQSDAGFGGTWQGTVENLKAKWSPCFVSTELREHPGTKALLEQGCSPVSTEELMNLKGLEPSQTSLF